MADQKQDSGYDKVVVPVVYDVPAAQADIVLAGLKAAYPTYTTGKGTDENPTKVHDTEFILAGRGEDRRIEHRGRLGAPLRGLMASFVKGVLWNLEG